MSSESLTEFPLPTSSSSPTSDPLPSESPTSNPLPSESPTSCPTSSPLHTSSPLPSESPTSFPTSSPLHTSSQLPTSSPLLTSSPPLDDFPVKEGAILDCRYEVVAFVGEGVFGKVAKCDDTETNKKIAIKIIKFGNEKEAQKEIKILKQLQTLDDKGDFVIWYGSFLHEDLICLKFELLDLSLFDYMVERNFESMSMAEIRPILHQVTTALLHLGALEIIHSDLKPDNIMILDRRQQPLKVKLIDFGLAHRVSDVDVVKCVQALWFRAPEVILGISYKQSIDVWSLGLIVAELAVAFPIFPAPDEHHIMKFIVNTLGQPTDDLLEAGVYSNTFFNSQGGIWELMALEEIEDPEEVNDTRCFNSLQDLEKLIVWEHHTEEAAVQDFVDVLKKMLHLDQNQRIRPYDMLEHPFLSVGAHQHRAAYQVHSS